MSSKTKVSKWWLPGFERRHRITPARWQEEEAPPRSYRFHVVEMTFDGFDSSPTTAFLLVDQMQDAFVGAYQHRATAEAEALRLNRKGTVPRPAPKFRVGDTIQSYRTGEMREVVVAFPDPDHRILTREPRSGAYCISRQGDYRLIVSPR